MISNFTNFFDFKGKSIFLINFSLIILIIIFFLFSINLRWFFYIDIFITLVFSFFFFKKSRKVAKYLILTNMFIFFYFLYPEFANYLYELIGSQSYFIVLFYTLFLGVVFLTFSGFSKTFVGNLQKFNFKFFLIIILIGIFLGYLFYMVREPIPQVFIDFASHGISGLVTFLLLNSFVVALSEELIFAAFLFNVYRNLTSRYDAIFQTSIIFTLFHLLRFHQVVVYYFQNFTQYYIFYSTIYYLLLFLFMVLALYLYSFKGKKWSGNFIYPLILHLVTDLFLFLFYILFGG